MQTFRFPSKTFLLGEYAVLQGSSALLLGHGPHFTATHEPSAATDAPFHPESPAGLWLKSNPTAAKIRLQDPHEARGGYGGSGAEFLAAWSFEKNIPALDLPRAIFAWSAWEDSRGGGGSGADILVQAFGVNRLEPFFLEVDLLGRSLKEIYPLRNQGLITLFHTGRKLATHEQKTPANLPLEEMEDMVLRAGSWLEKGLFEGFAREVQAYGEMLATLGLVAPHTAQALKSLAGKDEVFAKGCGAMGADVILVVHRGADLEGWARENSLAETGTYPI